MGNIVTKGNGGHHAHRSQSNITRYRQMEMLQMAGHIVVY